PVMWLELLFQAACVSLFLPGGQARVYPARKKPASFAVESYTWGRQRAVPCRALAFHPLGCLRGSGRASHPIPSHPIPTRPSLCPGGERDQGRVTLAGVLLPTSVSCSPCPPGDRFSPSPCAGGGLDIDECLSAACEGLCVNTEGGFVCECGPGMQLSADRHSCQDTDECLATPCQHRCKNSIGSYRCSCRPGYHLHGNRHSCV
ncbi:VWCE protein, partial [Nyctibius grandis]|nr:VWCE protein [Nyctibius grandis]